MEAEEENLSEEKKLSLGQEVRFDNIRGVHRGGNRRLDASNYFATMQDVGNMEVLNHCDKILGVICSDTIYNMG